jgi:hypothetical protein
MAAPNLASSTSTVTGKTAVLAATNTMTAVLANAAASGTCCRVEAVYASNIHATLAGWVTVTHFRSSADVRICYQLPVPLNGSFNLLGGRILYLEEGDSLRVQANASSYIEVVVPYELCS